jgi:acyl carrier protein phosphodiesterase
MKHAKGFRGFHTLSRPSWSKRSPHRQLAAFSQQAHEATAVRDTERVREIEAAIDRLAAELWGLTEAELQEIRESLEELK